MNREIEMDVMRVLADTDPMERDRISACFDSLCKFGNKLPWLNKDGLQRELDLLATEIVMVMERMSYHGFPVQCPFTLKELDQLRDLLVMRDSDSPSRFIIDLSPRSTDNDDE